MGHSLAFMAVVLAPGRDAPKAEERVDRPLAITLVVEGEPEPLATAKPTRSILAPVVPPAPIVQVQPREVQAVEPVATAPVAVAEPNPATPLVPKMVPRVVVPGPLSTGEAVPVASATLSQAPAMDLATNALPSPRQVGVKAVPKYGNNPEVPYPAQAKRRHQQGLVILAVTVSERGRAANVRIKESSGFPLLDEAALAAVRSWSFEPAQVNSVPVASEIEVPVRFSLRL